MKYSDLLMRWLNELGYSHCFFVAGGNSMHLLDGARQTMKCIPVVHEVAAGIAAEYFNERARAIGSPDRAFAMVTAGPGLTNILTAMAGAYLESRDLLVLGGQVKSTDLAGPTLRQRGIQEIDGLALAAPISVLSERIERPIDRQTFASWVTKGTSGRPGPVFIEICLDAQAAPVAAAELDNGEPPAIAIQFPPAPVAEMKQALARAQRPVLLLGGGVSREAAATALPGLRELSLPTMTTWNGADRIGSDDPVFAGRPNTWGQRGANVALQQADLVLALGTRLGLQQTGFNWQGFAPLATVVQVDIDPAELAKGHPKVDIAWHGDADTALAEILAACAGLPGWAPWLAACKQIRADLPNVEANTTADGYLDPFKLVEDLSALCTADDIIVPCSSGGAFTVAMQTFEQKLGQTVITDKGLASMGYGLSGAIGAAIASPGTRTVHIEGDGGFIQNLQEMATVAVNGLPIKTFIFSNEGYGSIRMTQRNYFGGAYLGCDVNTGLGFPDWRMLAKAFDIAYLELTQDGLATPGFEELFNSNAPAFFVVPVDPEQTYFPKISSRVTETGSMESNPLHLMSPDLAPELAARVFHHLDPK